MHDTMGRKVMQVTTLAASVALTLAAAVTPAAVSAEATGPTESADTGRIFTFGHSYAAGLGASRPSKSWAALVAARTCRPLINKARSGDLSAETETQGVLATDAIRPGDVAVVETGINDVRLFGPDGDLLNRYGQHVGGILAHFAASKQAVPVVLIADPGIADSAWDRYAPYDRGSQQLADAYIEKLKSVAHEYPNATVVDVRSGWSEATIAADGVHPNDRGHALMADAVVSALRSRDLSRCRPVERIDIAGPDVIEAPYSSTRYTAAFVPERSWQQATWAVTAPDGTPTDRAEIDDEGVLTVKAADGEVRITATAADGSGTRATKVVRLALDVGLLRTNASRWSTATATASSEYNAAYGADRVHDGVVGAPDGGDWASAGEQNPWIELSWSRPVRADEIVLYDRAGVDDAKGGTLTFGDGTTVEVTDIPADGSARPVTFAPKSFSSVRFQVRGGTGPNVGLAELEVRAFPTAPPVPTAVTAAAGQGEATVSWRPPDFDGGAPITGYAVTPVRDGTALEPIVVDASNTELLVPVLTSGESYTFTVAATNIVGTGEDSPPTDPVTPA